MQINHGNKTSSTTSIHTNEPFYGLLTDKQWNELQKYCQKNLTVLWINNKSTFFKDLYEDLQEKIFNEKEPTHAEMMKVLQFLKNAPFLTDEKLKYFLNTIKIETPKEIPMSLVQFKQYMRRNTMLAKQQKSKVAAKEDIDTTFPTTKFNVAGKSLTVSGHVNNPEDNDDLWIWEFLFDFDGIEIEINDAEHALKDLNNVIKLIYTYL